MNKEVKKSTAILIFICTTVFCFFCYFIALSPNTFDTNKSNSDNISVIDTTSMLLNSLKIDNEKLKKDLEACKIELEKYKTAPENLLIELRNSYELKDYDKSNELINEIHKIANGTTFDIEAQKINNSIKEEQEKTNVQKAKDILEVTSATVSKKYYEYIGGLEYMTININYKINCENADKISFYLTALDSNNNTVNLYPYSSDDLYIIESSGSKTKGKYSDTFNVNWSNTSISKIRVWKVEVTINNTKFVLTNYDKKSNNELKFDNQIQLSTIIPSSTLNTSNKSDVKKEVIVYITETGSKYHRSSCSYLRQSKIQIDESKAIRQGYTPCSRCNP